MPILTALMLASAAAPAAPALPASCPSAGSHHVDRIGAKPVGPQRLNEMPRADRIAAVARYDDKGCLRPIVYTRGIGSEPAPR